MLLNFKDKRGISVAALSVAAIVIIALASVITISLTGNYNDAKKIEFAQELNMIKIAVDNYYYKNGSYPISDKQLNISNLSQELKQTQFYDEKEVNGSYMFYVIDSNLINISSLKYGKGIDGLYDSYVVSVETGNVYYAKGIKIGNEIYYTLNKELSGLLTGNNKLEINSNSAVLFSETKLNNGKVSVKISVPTSYEIKSVKFENKEIELDSQGEEYKIYYVETEEKGTINVDYDYNQATHNATYLVKHDSISSGDEIINLIIRLSTELPTTGPITASIVADKTIPNGYVIQYKVNDGEWADGSKIENITKNCVIYSRIYNSTLLKQIAENQKDVNNIDIIAPTITGVTGNPSEWTNGNAIITVNGAKDEESGLHLTETYSFDNGATWQTSNVKLFEENKNDIIIKVKDKAGNIYTHEPINIRYIDKIAPTAIEIIGNIQYWSKWDVSININGATDNESGLPQKPYSYDNGVTWQNEAYKIFSQNTSNIIIKIKDKAGNVYTHEPIDIKYLDKETPTITEVIKEPSGWTNENVELIINGAQDSKSGLAEKPYSFDNGVTWQKENSKIYSENTSNIIIKVRDNVDNIYVHEVINIGNIDKILPSVPTDIEVITRENEKIVIKAIGSSDNESGVQGYQYSIDGVNWTETINDGINFGFNSLEQNTNYTIFARAVDMAGNVSENIYTKQVSTLGSYTITYDSNTTEEVIDMPSEQTKIEGQTLTLSTNQPTRVGYTFVGWATSANGTKVYDSGSNYTNESSIILYALWSVNTPEVTITVENKDINLFDDVTTTFTANVGNTKEVTYKWYYNDTIIDGATSSTYSISTSEMTPNNYNGGTYKVIVTNPSGSKEISSEQTVVKTISTAEQMKNFANRVNNQSITFLNDTVTQTADIDLSTVCSATLGNWTPIGDHEEESYKIFNGNFDGQNYLIDNIYISTDNNIKFGLFGLTGGTASIKNVNINSGKIESLTNTGNLEIGGIVGCNYGLIENCSNQASISSVNGNVVGGIVGTNAGNIVNSHNKGTITGVSSVGGIIGLNYSEIKNCYNIASINGYNLTGGIVGYNYTGNVSDSYNNGNIQGTNIVGGIIGLLETGDIIHCYNKGKISGSNMVAGICAKNYSDNTEVVNTIYRCYNEGEIEANNPTNAGQNVAGIISDSINKSIISECYNTGNVTLKGVTVNNCKASGIVSYGYGDGTGYRGTELINCYNTGTIKTISSSTYPVAAGIVGQFAGYESAEAPYTMANCYNIGQIIVESAEGVWVRNASLVGWIYDKSNISNCYWLETTGDNAIIQQDVLYGKSNLSQIINQAEVHSAEYMKTSYFVADLGNDNWKIVSGVNNGYPILEWQDGTEISVDFTTVSTAQALKDFAMIVNEKGVNFHGKTVTQLADIDLSTVCSATLGSWTPIGDYNSVDFSGTYNGNSKTINNLYINDTTKIEQGLFGRASNAIIKNVTIVNPYIVANTRVGALIGTAYNNTNISAAHINSGCVYGYVHIGAIAGDNNASLISMCSNSATVGTYMTTEVTEEAGGFGGLVGCNPLGTIEKSVNYGIVEGFKYLGGICGINWGIIKDCYNVGTIKPTVNTYKYFIGGIVGTQNGNNTEYKIENCYNIGNIINNNDVYYYGGVVGTTDCILTNNYYLEGIAPGGVNSADIAGQADSLPAEYMKTSEFVYSTLGAENWKIVLGVNNEYPILKWQEGTEISMPWAGIFQNSPTTSGQTLESGTIILKSGGVQYGPYVALQPGKFRVKYVGQNLNAVSQGQYYSATNYDPNGAVSFTTNFEKYESNEVIYTFTNDIARSYIETCLNNNSGQDITIDYIFIQWIAAP